MSFREHQMMLDKANYSVDSMKEHVKCEKFRNHFHFMAPAFWLNDPNGLIYYKGQYHMFYQHNPYASFWGPMHWGHAVSNDLVFWEHRPIALAPSESYDNFNKGGCFSGCAVDNDGVLSLFFTACAEKVQSQCVATSTDGIRFSKHIRNPILFSPPDCSMTDFRDPKIWRHDDLWYMIVGTCYGHIGKAALFRSANLSDWEFAGTICGHNGKLGSIWECPDFFELHEKNILVVSPIGAEQKNVIYLVGHMGYKDMRFQWNLQGFVDYGSDLYAPQTFLDAKGRRIMIGWLRNTMSEQDCSLLVRDIHWCGSMSIPRIIDIREDGKLCFTPYDGLQILRHHHAVIEDKVLTEEEPLHIQAGDGLSYEIIIEFKIEDTYASEIGIVLRASDNEQTVIRININDSELILDRARSDKFKQQNMHCPIEDMEDGLLKIHLFVDISAIEIFVNDGVSVISGNIYPSSDSRNAWLYVKDGSAKIKEMNTWGLSSIWS